MEYVDVPENRIDGTAKERRALNELRNAYYSFCERYSHATVDILQRIIAINVKFFSGTIAVQTNKNNKNI